MSIVKLIPVRQALAILGCSVADIRTLAETDRLTLYRNNNTQTGGWWADAQEIETKKDVLRELLRSRAARGES